MLTVYPSIEQGLQDYVDDLEEHALQEKEERERIDEAAAYWEKEDWLFHRG